MHFDDAMHDDAAISRQELLQRAAELGPQRLTYASMLLPTDPVLSQKMQPSVAQRRARLRTVVKVALGACVAFCLFAATRASAMSTSTEPAPVARLSPASAVVPVEKLEQAQITKASRGAPAAHAAAPTTARWKRR